MKSKVFMREENAFKTVEIFDERESKISEQLLEKWQRILNIVSDLIGVSAALIMRISPESLEVFLKDENGNNPYVLGASEALGSGLYCETVIGKNDTVFIENALELEAWKDNPALHSNMISYYGQPIQCSDGEFFGTICILNESKINLKEAHQHMISELKEIIERDLDILSKEEDFENFFDISLDLHCIADLEGNFIRLNDSWERRLGYSVSELKSINFMDLVHPDDVKITEKAVLELKNKNKILNFINRFKDQNGNYHFIEWNSKIAGRYNYIYASARDITEKLIQNEAIKQQKKELDFILTGIDAGTWQWNVQTGKTKFNERWAEGLGYTLEALEPISVDTWRALIHPKDIKVVEKNLHKHFNGEIEQYDVEIRKKHKDGHWVWMNDLGKVLSWTENHEPYEMFGVQIDISDRKEKEKKIKASERKYRTFFKSAPSPVFVLDSSGNYKDINYKAIEMLGYSRDEFLSMNIIDLIVPEDQQKAIRKMKSLLENSHMTIEVDLLTKLNNRVSIILDVVYLDKGLYLAFAKNITQRNQEKKALNFQYKCQRELTEITSNILDIDASNFNEKVNFSLEKIGKTLKIDHSYVYKYEKDLNHFSLTHEWCNQGALSHNKRIEYSKADAFPWPWWIEKLIKNEVIFIEKTDEITMKEDFNAKIFHNDIKSVIIIPIFIENAFYGFFGFDTIKGHKSFNKMDLELIELFTNIMKNAINKYLNDVEIKNLTYRDHLTGLYNRRFFEEEVKRLDTKRQLPISIIVTDINGLKIINDSLGHKKGDLLIQKAANLLKEVTRDEDILARLSGDEFALILPKTSRLAAETIIKRIKQSMKSNSSPLDKVSMAVGLSVKNASNQKIEEVIQEADNNMYQNKLLSSGSAKGKIVENLMNVLAVKSNETKTHAMRMKNLALKLSEVLELGNTEINRLSLLATLHDIGKITISEEILKKSGELTSEEWEIVRGHCENGYRIANASEEFANIAKEIFSHHERWDGNGYPKKLKGKEIPYLARIIAIIDAYDVMTHDQHYKKAISKDEALDEILRCSGGQFDPDLVSTFIDIVR